MMTSLPLNDSNVFWINRDIALLLGLFFALSLFLRFSRKTITWPILGSVAQFFKDSTWEIGAIFILRSFFYEMYIIPSSSMQPTVYPGDVILVSKSSYGFRMPGTNTLLSSAQQPERGDIVVFLDPEIPTQRKMIKRMIGLPGDHIKIAKGQLFINGQLIEDHFVSQGFEYLPSSEYGSMKVQVQYFDQSLGQHTFRIQRTPMLENPELQAIELIVPQNHYFVMGDNRENSKDSRYIGFVPERFLCGKAQYVLMSFGRPHGYYEWDRLGALP